jgi:Xaa-Pro aminopeptidase
MNKELKNYMSNGWISNKQKNNVIENDSAKFAKKRRQKLLKQIGDKNIIIPAYNSKPNGLEKVKTDPNSDFIYLTGMNIIDVTDSMYLLLNNKDAEILYLEPPFTKDTESFFTNNVNGEYWTGPSDTLKIIQKKIGIKTKPLNELKIKNIINVEKNKTLKREINFLRMKKDEFEINEIKKAIKFTKLAFDNIIKNLPNANNEKELEVAFNSIAQLKGCGTGYLTIVGSGNNSTYLHWSKNNSKIKNNDIVLIDAGVQTKQMYTADITRTFPKNGKFTNAQKKVYDAVLTLNKIGINMCKKNVKWFDIQMSTAKKLSEFLNKWGVINKSANEIFDKQFYKRYMIHGVGHPLGIDVHDNMSFTKKDNDELVLKNGYIMTIEPGIYFRNDDSYVPKELRGIGIRIEDNILITNDAPIVLSKSIPKEIKDIEKWFVKEQKK